MLNPTDLLSFTHLVFLVGLLHFCTIPAVLAGPKTLGWREDLAKLQPINRRIVLVIGGGIQLTIIGMGVVVMLAAAEIASGTRLGIVVAGFLAVFWTYRWAVQAFLYTQVWPRNRMGRVSHYSLLGLFAFQTLIYWASVVLVLSGEPGAQL